ncbi:helix-turn-helix transcriptional regulator [Bacteroidia bacterium]|nr:helix-turn-helix transcriptional regulator [Bacteroidia bacterium]
MENIYSRFFNPIVPPLVDLPEYESIHLQIDMCDILSRVNNQSIYIIDYMHQAFLHVSPHPLFLCGYSADEVKAMGYSFYEKVISPDDLQMMENVNKLGWELFYNISTELRKLSCISYDFFLHYKNNNKVLVNHKLTPLRMTKDGNIWLGLCIVNYSSHKTSGNVIYALEGNKQYYTYDFKKKQLVRYSPGKPTKREKEVLRLAMRGYNETEISERLNISVHTVKKHRQNTERKLGVNNLTNAVTKFNLSF